MATIPFNVNLAGAPPFTAIVTLDGVTYNLVAMWSVYRSDWYLSLYDQSGARVSTQPLIGSPPNATIALFPGLFKTSTISFVPSLGSFVVTP